MKSLKWFCFHATLFAAVAAVSAQPPLPRALPTLMERNLAYGPHERNKLDLYHPPGEGPYPLIIWVHGGAWKAGSKDDGGPAKQFVAQGLRGRRHQLPLQQSSHLPGEIEDCKAAVRWLRAHASAYHLDTDHFGAWARRPAAISSP